MTRAHFLRTIQDRVEQDFTGPLTREITYDEMEEAVKTVEGIFNAEVTRLRFESEPQSAAEARGDA